MAVSPAVKLRTEPAGIQPMQLQNITFWQMSYYTGRMLRYAITDGKLAADDGIEPMDRFTARCVAMVAAGADFLLIREKQLGAGALANVSRRVVAACGGRVKVLLSGRVDVAMAVGAAGVNLTGRDGELTVTQVRRLMPEAFVSVSCHSVEQVMWAASADASAILFAPVFRKVVDGVEVVAGMGPEALRKACVAAGRVPVFALGGVTESNAEECMKAGAMGVAGIRLFAAV
jgi:thiamine-phosphate pyrophosphorylase